MQTAVKAVIGAADEPNTAIAVVVPIGYAAEPGPNPGRLPFEYNVFSETLGTPYRP
ncbi:gsl1328 [Gloeobacter violaceus PCC 7421]|uniref:Gsl1328 protein n=1 Tax=Gloeobacter violaceus (strain ATCC 29082 / PCC 7421) TaxID=251221 RepID=Q7NKZ8_GLOVI|nr:hypothetical protein [Gloeobacter violaceus]BAC89269.1 gsl1328 [Gloeobacter violaceus PCC 7421]